MCHTPSSCPLTWLPPPHYRFSGTVTGKIFVHHPHGMAKETWEGASSDVRFLNIQKKINGLAAGPLKGSKDLLAIGTANELLAYNVETNSDSFHKEVR